jgi:hypothetical protein
MGVATAAVACAANVPILHKTKGARRLQLLLLDMTVASSPLLPAPAAIPVQYRSFAAILLLPTARPTITICTAAAAAAAL